MINVMRPRTPPQSNWAQRARYVAIASWLTANAAAQQGTPHDVGAADSSRTPAQWLQAVQQAALRQSYEGVIVYQHGSEVRTSRLTHYFDGTVAHEKLQPLDGRRREYIRKGEETHCLYPDSKRVVIESGASARGTFPALGVATPADIFARYSLDLGVLERVAGRDCQMLTLEPKDALRFGYRLCVDAASGLLVKVQTVGPQKEIIEQVAFTEVKVGGNMDPAHFRASWPVDGWQVERIDALPADLEAEGWRVQAPAGFVRRQQVRRSFQGGTQPTLQVVYSDGLATVSVFIEQVNSQATLVDERPRSSGPISMVSRRVAGAIVTVVGEVPIATAVSTLRTIEYVKR